MYNGLAILLYIYRLSQTFKRSIHLFQNILLFNKFLFKILFWTFKLSRSLLCMLHTWDQRILSRVIIFIGLQVIFVQCFFDWAHISIHFELIFNLKLLIKHVSIFLLIFSPLFFLESLHLVGMVCLHPSLVLIKILRVIHLFDMILLILLHLKLLVI